jgi:hypothetical protein
VAGGSIKELDLWGYWYKAGADLATINSFTEVKVLEFDQNATTGVADLGAIGDAQAIVALEISAADLDVANGFDCVKITVPKVGTNVQLGSLLYILSDPRHAGDPMPSAIVD